MLKSYAKALSRFLNFAKKKQNFYGWSIQPGPLFSVRIVVSDATGVNNEIYPVSGPELRVACLPVWYADC